MSYEGVVVCRFAVLLHQAIHHAQPQHNACKGHVLLVLLVLCSKHEGRVITIPGKLVSAPHQESSAVQKYRLESRSYSETHHQYQCASTTDRVSSVRCELV